MTSETVTELAPACAVRTSRKPILVGVDGSKGSEQALRWACEHAAYLGCDVLAVAVWHLRPLTSPDLVGFSPWWFTTNPDLTTPAFLEEATAPVAANFPQLTITRVVRSGRPADELSRLGQLIVVGATGRGGFAGMLLGSTSRELLQRSPCTVIVVR